MTAPSVLTVWTLYDHPLDYPAHYVVRESSASARGVVHHRIACLYDTREEAKADFEQHYWMPRWKDDDPTIVGAWL